MLDREKIKWMMTRRDSHWWEEDSWEVYEKLSADMDATMEFLEECSDLEIDIIQDELIELIQDFDQEDDVFFTFLEELARVRSLAGLKESLVFYKESAADEQQDDSSLEWPL